MDAVYPEPLFRQHRRAVRKKVHRGPASRYRTQPVTFAEIQEVDEENAEEQSTIEREAAKSERDLHARFQEFWRRSKQGDVASTSTSTCLLPSPETLPSLAALSLSPSPPPSPPPPPLQVPPLSCPRTNLTETSSKPVALAPQSGVSVSTPLHMLTDRSLFSRTSI